MARSGPTWSRLERQQERDVRELVRSVAGLRDEADPNFQLSLHLAWSHFRCGCVAGRRRAEAASLRSGPGGVFPGSRQFPRACGPPR